MRNLPHMKKHARESWSKIEAIRNSPTSRTGSLTPRARLTQTLIRTTLACHINIVDSQRLLHTSPIKSTQCGVAASGGRRNLKSGREVSAHTIFPRNFLRRLHRHISLATPQDLNSKALPSWSHQQPLNLETPVKHDRQPVPPSSRSWQTL